MPLASSTLVSLTVIILTIYTYLDSSCRNTKISVIKFLSRGLIKKLNINLEKTSVAMAALSISPKQNNNHCHEY